MSLYTIGDLHLSLGVNKPMEIFNGWNNYVDRLKENWCRLVDEKDTVVIAGDISWAMKIEEALMDFKFLDSLPGKKIILKGNHDYWWVTKTKIEKFFKENEINTISVLFNNSYVVDNIAFCGTRGWFYDDESGESKKVLSREVGRLKLSYDSCEIKPEIAFLHYPPVYSDTECEEMMNCLLELGIKKCYYGHIHGAGIKNAVNGLYKGIDFRLISADALKFVPYLVRN